RVEEINKIKEKCFQMKKVLKEKDLSVVVGIGSGAKDVFEIHESYHAAWRALELGKAMNRSSGIYYIHDLLIEDISSNIKDSVSYTYINELVTTLEEQVDANELKQTICAWCESGFNKKDAAETLYIHRNTFHYRIKKIESILGIDA